MKKQKQTGIAASENNSNEAMTEKQYVVKTKGYSETFRTETDAKQQYDFLKKRSVKNQESIKIELTEKDQSGNLKTLENVTIGDEFFN